MKDEKTKKLYFLIQFLGFSVNFKNILVLENINFWFLIFLQNKTNYFLFRYLNMILLHNITFVFVYFESHAG